MPKFAANITTMFDEANELDRLTHARALGFKYVEWLFPYDQDKHLIRERLEELGLRLILINTGLGSAAGDRGIGAVPGRESEFKDAFSEALEYVDAVDIPLIHVMAGICADQNLRDTYVEVFASNLQWAASQLGKQNTKLLIEPLNRVDTPDYLIGTTEEAIHFLRDLKCNVGLQFDFYHMQIMEGNLGPNLRQNIDKIKHVQFSSLPGRHEPQHGEINCDYLFDLLDNLSYDGYVGCEYRPKTTVEEGLIWGARYGLGAATGK